LMCQKIDDRLIAAGDHEIKAQEQALHDPPLARATVSKCLPQPLPQRLLKCCRNFPTPPTGSTVSLSP
jgi:hypothetical protein